MQQLNQISFAPPADAIRTYLEKHLSWMKAVCGSNEETILFEYHFPLFANCAVEDLFGLNSIPLDRKCLWGIDAARPHIVRWETPPGWTPRIELIRSHDRNALVTSRQDAWDFHWVGDIPLAVFLKEAKHAAVFVRVPFISFATGNGLTSEWKEFVIVHRDDVPAVLDIMLKMAPPKRINLIGDRPDIPLPEGAYDWSSLILTPRVNDSLPGEYETFWKSEEFFSKMRLGFNRRVLLYGPPGSGKTTATRILAAHPQVTACMIDLRDFGNDALQSVLQTAADQAPALVILEELDRVWVVDGASENRSGVTLPFFLNAIESVGNGVFVVATANRPQLLDKAILRPGRLDRHFAFPLPGPELRLEFFRRITGGAIDDISLSRVAKRTDGFSYAALRECYIQAAYQAMEADFELKVSDLLAAAKIVRNGVNGAFGNGNGHVGFAQATIEDQP